MYTYIFGVRMEVDKNLNTKLELDFLLEYSDDDVSRVKMALEQINNEMWSSTSDEALSSWDTNRIVAQIHGMKMRFIQDDNIKSIHKFSSEDKWDRESISCFVEMSNACKETKKLLIKRIIKL